MILTVPNGFTKVENHRFQLEDTYTKIVLPHGMTEIGDHAFKDFNELRAIELPDTIKSIGSWAFSGCKNLTTIQFPAGKISLGDKVFEGCHKLENPDIADKLDQFTWRSFAGWGHLNTSIYKANVKTFERDLRNCETAYQKEEIVFLLLDAIDPTSQDEIIRYIRLRRSYLVERMIKSPSYHPALIKLIDHFTTRENIQRLIVLSQKYKQPELTTVLLQHSNKIRSKRKKLTGFAL